MEGRAGIVDIVKEKITSFEIDSFDELRSNIQEQLIQIEYYLQQTVLEQKLIAEKVKSLNKINVDSVAKGANVGRSTIYNNPHTIKHYIIERISEIEKEDILLKRKNEGLKLKEKEIRKVKEGLEIEVVENFLLNTKIKELEEEVQELNKSNQGLLLELHSLKKQLQKVNIDSRIKNNSNIYSLNKD